MTTIAEELVKTALREWEFFGHSEMRLDGTSTVGKKEYEKGASDRIADYWSQLPPPYNKLTGSDRGWAWSAAFVSHCMRAAGAGDKFPYSASHATYINEAIRNGRNGQTDGTVVGRRLSEHALRPGDLIGYWRGDKPITFDNAPKLGFYISHCDIVVEVGSTKAWVVGGNVQHSVTKREVRVNAKKHLTDKGSNWFVVLANDIIGGNANLGIS